MFTILPGLTFAVFCLFPEWYLNEAASQVKQSSEHIASIFEDGEPIPYADDGVVSNKEERLE